MLEIKGKYTDAHIMIDDIDETTMSQIVQMTNHPAFTKPIRIMPDCHAGKGSVIGFTMPITDKLIPNIVGVDVGCGVHAIEIDKNILSDYDKLKVDKHIRERIPFGINVNEERYDIKNNFPWLEIQKEAITITNYLNKLWYMNVYVPTCNYDYFLDMCKRIGLDVAYAECSISSVGSGNHYCEIGKSENTGNIWITTHTGSRNLGKKVCEYWQNIAKGDKNTKNIEFNKKLIKLKNEYSGKKLGVEIKKLRDELNKNITVKSTGLEFLEGENVYGYLYDMIFAQYYAKINRIAISDILLDILGVNKILQIIDTVHNYIDFKDFIIRKGSISAYDNEYLIIPLNMEDGTLLCKGKSNPDWNYSAPHGAGRLLSRSKAKDVVNIENSKKSMRKKGVFSTSIPIDEVKEVYKDSKVIEEAIKETVTIIDKITPIHNIKDNKDNSPSWKRKDK